MRRFKYMQFLTVSALVFKLPHYSTKVKNRCYDLRICKMIIAQYFGWFTVVCNTQVISMHSLEKRTISMHGEKESTLNATKVAPDHCISLIVVYVGAIIGNHFHHMTTLL